MRASGAMQRQKCLLYVSIDPRFTSFCIGLRTFGNDIGKAVIRRYAETILPDGLGQ
jgi:hypothetical protein